MGVCECILGYTPEDRECGNPADRLYIVACMHEHVVIMWLCPACYVLQPRAICNPCWLYDRHQCPITALEAPPGSELAAEEEWQ